MRAELTETQGKIYSFIVSYHGEKRIMPSIREMQQYFGYKSSNSVVSQLIKLEDKGYILRNTEGMKARSLRLVDEIMEGEHTIGAKRLSNAIRDLKDRGYNLALNEVVELFSELNIKIV